MFTKSVFLILIWWGCRNPLPLFLGAPLRHIPGASTVYFNACLFFRYFVSTNISSFGTNVLTSVLFRRFRTMAALYCSLNLKVAFRGRLGGFQCTSTEGVGWVDLPPSHLLRLCRSCPHKAYFSATCPSPGRVTVPPAIDLSRSHIAAIVESKQEDFSFAGNITKLRHTKCFSECSAGCQFHLSNADLGLYCVHIGPYPSQLYSLYSLIRMLF